MRCCISMTHINRGGVRESRRQQKERIKGPLPNTDTHTHTHKHATNTQRQATSVKYDRAAVRKAGSEREAIL